MKQNLKLLITFIVIAILIYIIHIHDNWVMYFIYGLFGFFIGAILSLIYLMVKEKNDVGDK